MKKFKPLAFLAVLALTQNVAFAQSKIQCQVDAAGVVSAPLIWQNTLGAEKANSICRAHIGPVEVVIKPASVHYVNQDQVAANGHVRKANSQARAAPANGRFDGDTYARANTSVPAKAHVQTVGHNSYAVNMSPQQPAYQPMNDYVPLEQSGGSLPQDNNGYVSLW